MVSPTEYGQENGCILVSTGENGGIAALSLSGVFLV
jgi:hypothetical protein